LVWQVFDGLGGQMIGVKVGLSKAWAVDMYSLSSAQKYEEKPP